MSCQRLESACLNGDLAAAEAVLAPLSEQQQRDLVQQSDRFNFTPLHFACRYGHLAVAEMLIGKGADMEAKDWGNSTPLHFACWYGHLAVAEMLIGKGADMEAKDGDNSTPLHLACVNGHLAVAEMLIGKGADMEAKDKDNQTPLDRACRYGHLAVAEMLIGKGADMEAKDKYNNTPLHLACWNGHLAVAEILIGKGADMEAKDKDNQTPLDRACENGHLAVAERLIGKGADMEAKNDDGRTPLDVCESDEMRRHLKQAAANVQARAASAPAAHGARAVRSSARPGVASGRIAASPGSRAAPVPAPARQSAPEHRTAPAAVNNAPDIFLSLRFGEALPAAEALKVKLQAKGVSAFLCAVAAGGDLVDEIVENIDACRLVVILGTKTYGKDTGVGFCTKDELKFIIGEKKKIFLVKMCDRFDEAIARFRLGPHIMYHLWKPVSEAEQRQVPDVIVDEIIDKLHNL